MDRQYRPQPVRCTLLAVTLVGVVWSQRLPVLILNLWVLPNRIQLQVGDFKPYEIFTFSFKKVFLVPMDAFKLSAFMKGIFSDVGHKYFYRGCLTFI